MDCGEGGEREREQEGEGEWDQEGKGNGIGRGRAGMAASFRRQGKKGVGRKMGCFKAVDGKRNGNENRFEGQRNEGNDEGLCKDQSRMGREAGEREEHGKRQNENAGEREEYD
jgi:hypothetical protein